MMEPHEYWDMHVAREEAAWERWARSTTCAECEKVVRDNLTRACFCTYLMDFVDEDATVYDMDCGGGE